MERISGLALAAPLSELKDVIELNKLSFLSSFGHLDRSRINGSSDVMITCEGITSSMLDYYEKLVLDIIRSMRHNARWFAAKQGEQPVFNTQPVRMTMP